MQYQLGDMVQWSSQAAGHVKVKTGEALAVLPAKVAVHKVVKPILADGQHTSEIPGKARPKLYWPRVSALSLVSRPELSVEEDVDDESDVDSVTLATFKHKSGSKKRMTGTVLTSGVSAETAAYQFARTHRICFNTNSEGDVFIEIPSLHRKPRLYCRRGCQVSYSM